MKPIYFIQLQIEEIVLRGISELSNTDDKLSNQKISLIYKKAHHNIINSLISTYIKNTCVDYKNEKYIDFLEEYEEIESYKIPADLELNDIPYVCEDIYIDYLNTELFFEKGTLKKKKSKKSLLEMGAVYTPSEIAYSITLRTLDNLKPRLPEQLKILDFATGTGRFYRQIVRCCKELWDLKPDFSITNNIYAIDVDPVAINICRLNAFALLKEKNLENLRKITEHIVCRDALIKQPLFQPFFDTDCPFVSGFDAIVSNPPYLVLKPNRSKMDSKMVENIIKMANYFRSSNDYHYSVEGMLNLYQISLEAMEYILKDGGEMGIICPSTLFADLSATKLRKHFLSEHCISYIKYFSEDEQLFYNVTQATCIFHLKKNGTTDQITIEQGKNLFKIQLDDVKSLMPENWEIPCISMIEWDILKKLEKIPKLQQYTSIRNKRGELDLSLFKGFITTDITPYRLVRGNMISHDGIKDINHEYVLPSFFEMKTEDFKKNDFGRERLVCQQISNQSQKTRLHFVECEPNDILGNSCNYILIKSSDIVPMKIILNSALLNWRFKITSTNNHINNYEIDELPIIDLSILDKSTIKLDKLQRDKKICQLYGLNTEETEFILSNFYETI